jgi:hypothetical protein
MQTPSIIILHEEPAEPPPPPEPAEPPEEALKGSTHLGSLGLRLHTQNKCSLLASSSQKLSLPLLLDSKPPLLEDTPPLLLGSSLLLELTKPLGQKIEVR